VPPSVIEDAINAVKQFTKDHPALEENDFAPVSASDELSVLSVGNPAGRVFRVVGLASQACAARRSARSALAHPAPHQGRRSAGRFRRSQRISQAITSDQTFGYIPYSVKLQKTNCSPTKCMAQNPSPGPQTVSEPVPEPKPERPLAATAPIVVPSAAPGRVAVGGLTARQLRIAVMLLVGVFAAMILALMQFGGK
jgi:hypothetical protein